MRSSSGARIAVQASHIDAPRPTGAPRGGLRALCSPATLTGGLTELAWVGAHVLMYPLGTRTEALRPDPRNRPGDQPPAVRALFAADPLAARIPVLLVHGLVDNRSIFAVMRRSLRRRGFAHVCSWNYSPLLPDVARGAADLGAHIERICEQTGHDRVHVVGHSLGGLIARYHVQRQGGDRRVRLAGHAGHAAPRLGAGRTSLPTPLVRQLRPGSPVLQELAEPAPGCRTPVTADLQRPRPDGRCPPRPAAATTPTSRRATCSSAASGTCRCRSTAAVVDEVAATLAGVRGPAGTESAVAWTGAVRRRARPSARRPSYPWQPRSATRRLASHRPIARRHDAVRCLDAS